MISKFLENWKENPPPHLSVRYLSICVLIAIVYFVCGKLGLRFAVVHPSATPVWPDSGLMLAAFLLLGVRVWPAFLISAFLVNLATPAGILNSLVIAAGNTAEGLLAAYLVTTYAGGLGFHSRPRLTFRFILLAALASTVVSASAGTTILSLTGSAHWAAYGRIWLAWWLGDAVSDLVVVPLVVVLVAASPSSWRPGRIIEFLLMAITLSLVAWTFSDPSEPLRFLCIPIIVWAAFRFGTTGAAVSVLLLAAFMIPGLLAVETSLLPGTRYSALLDVMWFVAVVSALALMVAAVVAERTRIDEDLRRARDELAGRVADVTKELAGTEVRLQVRETLLARAETVARTGSFEWNAASDHVIWSDELLNIHGRSREDIGDGIDELLAAVHREDREFVRALMRRTLAEGRPFRVLERIVGRDGKSRVLDCVGEPLYDATGTVSGVCGVCRDISDEQEFEKKLAESRDRFRMLIEGVKDYAIYLLDVDGNIASWNEGAERIMGYRAEEIIGRQVSLFYPEEAVPGAHADELLRTAGIDGSVEEEGWRIRKDGTRFWADVVITALREPDGGLRGFAKITRDLSERKASETALSELSGRLLEVQDEERRRIARELHDTSSPQLTSLIGKLYGLRRTQGPLSGSTADALEECLTLAESVSRVVRGIASQLYPPLLDHNGLSASLRWYVDSFSRRTGIDVRLEHSGTLRNISKEAELVLFRTVQECLANIDRRSIAKIATVRLEESQGAVLLEIIEELPGVPLPDDGDEHSFTDGIGMRGIVERLKQFGGNLEVETHKTATKITVSLPQAQTISGPAIE